MCQAAILHWWSINRQQALYANTLLNCANAQFQPLESGSQSKSRSTASAALQADAFWAVPPDTAGLLAFSYPQSAFPANFQPGVQNNQPRCRSDFHKRQQPDSSLAPNQHVKRARAPSGKHRSHSNDKATARRASQAVELSNKLQQRLATFLELVIAGSKTDANMLGVKQVG